MANTPRHSVSVAAVVTNDEGEVLVIQRRDNAAWQLPGGVLELDEVIEDGVRREVAEETGVTVEPTRLTGIYKNMKLGVVALVFQARPIAGSPGPTEESVAAEWWPADRVVAELDGTFKTRVRDALAFDSSPVIRHHDGVQFLDGDASQR
ncbi:NUDIX domain-containing protein [Actinoplanes sp. LDG1-06]|uniref:NUDIX domain-containing protein n=1 Tax=Paractinoplanes ovalisporus TaxID=2810368 RepID=A0ABS2AAJ8_9ACTN|nr:NUDIX domain-containing protein [Actinoplanes ovalisporus]MBM2616858.1 NUDIX domain-containing protein [Actinoplanes ovalisporus]